MPRQFHDGAGELDAGRPGADDDEGQERRAPLRIALALGAFEGHQNPPPQRGGVLQRFQPGRERLPLVVTEIGVARAGGEHERVVGDRIAVIEQHLFGRSIHAAHGGKQRRGVAPVAQQMPDRPGDLGGGERGGRDLIPP